MFLTEQYGINVEYGYAFETCEGAATPTQKKRLSILNAMNTLVQTGKKITQKAMEELTGLSQQLIAHHAKAFQGGWKGLLKKYKSAYIDSNREICIFDKSIDQVFKDWLNCNLLDFVKEVIQYVTDNGFSAFLDLVNQTSLITQGEIWATLLPVFTPELRDDFGDLSTSG